MKKTFRSVLAICVTLVFVMTLCPCFSVSAATDLNAITAESIAVNETYGNQVPTCIVADLNLPTEGIIWTSSNPEVISNTGVVTRPVAEDVAVTLTANDGTTTKDFAFVVKAKKTNVVAQESFCYDGLENADKTTDIFASMDGWSNAKATTASQIKTEANGNKYAEFGLNAEGGTYIDWYKSVTADKVTLDFDLMLNVADQTWSASYITAILNGTDASGASVSAQVRLAHISPDGWLYWGNADNVNDYIRLDSTKRLPATIEIDLANKTVAGSLIGGAQKSYDGDKCTEKMIGYQSNDVEVINNDGTKFTSVSWVRIFSNGSRNLDVDNFVLSTEAEVNASEINFEMLTSQTPKAITENLDFTKANAYVNGMGGTINWTSSDDEVLSVSDNTGIVTRPIGESETITLTATVSKGGKTTTKDFTFTVVSKKINVVAQDAFNYDGLENTDKTTNIFASMDGWSNAKATTASQIKTEANGNKYAEFGLNAEGGAYIDWNKSVTADKVTLDFDLMLNAADQTWSASYITAILNGTDASGASVSAQVRLAHISPDGWLYWGKGENNGDYIHLDSTKRLPATIEIDLANKTITGSLIGGTGAGYQGDTHTENMTGFEPADDTAITDAGITFTSVSLIRFVSNGSRNLDVDNFVLSTEAVANASNIEFDMLTTQSYKAVTENLNLSAVNADVTGLGGTINWVSSDAEVVSINDNTAVVTRPATESADVTLTATVEHGGKTTTKDFTFTVINSKTNIVAQESFSYEGLENLNKNANIFDSMNGWSDSKATTASQIKTDANNNKFAEFGVNAGADIKWNVPVTANKMTLDFDLKLNTSDATKGATYITALLNGTNAAGEAVSVEVQLAHVAQDGWLYWGYANNNKDAARLDSSKMLPVSVELDLTGKTLSSSLIGTPVKEYPNDIYVDTMTDIYNNEIDEGIKFTSVSWVRFFNSGSSRNIYVDNFVMSTSGVYILDGQCNDAGVVTATLRNLGAASQNAVVICAGYKDGKMVEVEVTDSTTLLSAQNTIVTFEKDFSGATSYNVFVIDNLSKLQPLCKNFGGTVANK